MKRLLREGMAAAFGPGGPAANGSESGPEDQKCTWQPWLVTLIGLKAWMPKSSSSVAGSQSVRSRSQVILERPSLLKPREDKHAELLGARPAKAKANMQTPKP